jgi:hypothetical protein
MGRTITGGLMIGWSLVIIPANLAAGGTDLDLWFGLLLLISGAVLASSGWQRARPAAHRETGNAESATSRQETGSAERVAASLFLSVASGLITGLLQKLLGI